MENPELGGILADRNTRIRDWRMAQHSLPRDGGLCRDNGKGCTRAGSNEIGSSRSSVSSLRRGDPISAINSPLEAWLGAVPQTSPSPAHSSCTNAVVTLAGHSSLCAGRGRPIGEMLASNYRHGPLRFGPLLCKPITYFIKKRTSTRES
jgi:hypothetical protein